MYFIIAIGKVTKKSDIDIRVFPLFNTQREDNGNRKGIVRRICQIIDLQLCSYIAYILITLGLKLIRRHFQRNAGQHGDAAASAVTSQQEGSGPFCEGFTAPASSHSPKTCGVG